LPNAAHFIQEDEPELLVEHLKRFLTVQAPADRNVEPAIRQAE
jgi:hypothetical protein